MRATKVAIAAALAADTAVSDLVPVSQIYAVERATIPALPSIELIGVTSERQATALVRHEIQVEITVAATTEDAADETLDAIVKAIRGRLSAAENGISPVTLAGGANAVVVVQSVRWSISASDKASVIRGASIAVSAEGAE